MKSKKPIIIELIGAAGSGKTTLSQRLCKQEYAGFSSLSLDHASILALVHNKNLLFIKIVSVFIYNIPLFFWRFLLFRKLYTIYRKSLLKENETVVLESLDTFLQTVCSLKIKTEDEKLRLTERTKDSILKEIIVSKYLDNTIVFADEHICQKYLSGNFDPVKLKYKSPKNDFVKYRRPDAVIVMIGNPEICANRINLRSSKRNISMHKYNSNEIKHIIHSTNIFSTEFAQILSDEEVPVLIIKNSITDIKQINSFIKKLIIYSK